MIQFFRKIRQQLVSEGKTGRYLKYALGEIVLVVIGIFIAIQLNVAFQNAKDARTETKYLKGILSNLDQNIRELEEHAKTDSIKMVSLTHILLAFTVDSIKSNEAYMKSIILASLPVLAFRGNNVVFEDMKSSGRINFIQSDSLRRAVQSYYRLFSEVKEREEVNILEIANFRNKSINTHLDINSVLEPLFSNEVSAEVTPFDPAFFERNIKSEEVTQFSNNVSVMKGITIVNSRLRGSLLEEAKELKLHIDNYISENSSE